MKRTGTYNWDQVRRKDWANKQDAVISREVSKIDLDGKIILKHGKAVHPTRERVRQKRLIEARKARSQALKIEKGPRRARSLEIARKIGHPDSWHNRVGTTKEKIGRMKTNKLTAKQIATEAGCVPSYVTQALKKLGKKCIPAERGSRAKYAWPDKKDPIWKELTNTELARKLGVNNPMVVYQHRLRYKIAKKVKESVKPKVRQVEELVPA